MNQSADFCATRAQEAAAEAKAAKLANVRQRALRSAAAWRQIASRARSVEKDRAQRIAQGSIAQMGIAQVESVPS